MRHDGLVALIGQHLYTLYDEYGSVCTCGDAKDGNYPKHLAKMIEELEQHSSEAEDL